MATIESMDAAGVAEAMEWAADEGWEPGFGDAEPFFAADPGGFFRSEIDGRTGATLSVVRGSEEVAFVGLYIVTPRLRGQGYGRELWNQVLGRFDGITLGLDAVPAQVESYRAAGFETAHENARYSAERLPGPDGSIETVPATEVEFEALAAFDGAHFFGPRPEFLRRWIAGPGRDALTIVDGGEITGFAASRQTASGHRIGPIFADDATSARALILGLADRIDGRVAFDLPQHPAGIELAGSMDLERGFETTRMYRGRPPELPLERIFGITTLELG